MIGFRPVRVSRCTLAAARLAAASTFFSLIQGQRWQGRSIARQRESQTSRQGRERVRHRRNTETRRTRAGVICQSERNHVKWPNCDHHTHARTAHRIIHSAIRRPKRSVIIITCAQARRSGWFLYFHRMRCHSAYTYLKHLEMKLRSRRPNERSSAKESDLEAENPRTRQKLHDAPKSRMSQPPTKFVSFDLIFLS